VRYLQRAIGADKQAAMRAGGANLIVHEPASRGSTACFSRRDIHRQFTRSKRMSALVLTFVHILIASALTDTPVVSHEAELRRRNGIDHL
jgi:hypothetical protein